MAKDKNKDKKEEVKSVIPSGMKCFQKIGGGSFRFKNRIIKSGQNFWINPELIPASFAASFKEVAADYKAVLVVGADTNIKAKVQENKNVAPKFEVVPAVDENGDNIMKGKDQLFNVINESGKPMNDKPLREGKAEEMAVALNV